MAGEVLTVVSAVVDPERQSDLTSAYRHVLGGALPDGLLASALLRGEGHHWQIATLWRDRPALDAMRASVETPAALLVFQAAGVTPTLSVFQVMNAVQRLI